MPVGPRSRCTPERKYTIVGGRLDKGATGPHGFVSEAASSATAGKAKPSRYRAESEANNGSGPRRGHDVALSADGNTDYYRSPGDKPGHRRQSAWSCMDFRPAVAGVWTQQGSKLDWAMLSPMGALEFSRLSRFAWPRMATTAIVGGSVTIRVGRGAAWV